MKIHLELELAIVAVVVLMGCGCEKSGGGGGGPSFNAFFSVSFDGHGDGTYTEGQLNGDWNGPPWNVGVREGRVTIVGGNEAYSGKSMRVSYPNGRVGLGGGGASWPFRFGARDDVYCSYRFLMRPGFDFVRGGKMPGLAGGAANDGGHRPNGRDGWSVRLMWRDNARMAAYVYHPDQPTQYGEYFDWSSGVAAGRWQQVVIHVRMNTPGQHDGIVQCWLNGSSVLNVDTLRFRDTSAFGIDQFFFSTFFGGGDSSWAPTRDEYITFDDFQVGTP